METRPHIIVIVADDMGYWAMGCAGNPEIRTPHLDRLAASGMRFDNFFCATPVCSPARATLLTGRIPSQHGVHDWLGRGAVDGVNPHAQELDEAIEYLQDMPGYTDFLAERGWRCGLSGKWHLGDSCRPQKNMHHWYALPGGTSPYNDPVMVRDGKQVQEEGYITDLITDDALRFMDQAQADETPFCLNVHYTAPHLPWVGEHPEALVASYDACPFNSCPDLPAHPWNVAAAPTDAQHRREILKGYFAAVTAMDTGIGRILDWLGENGQRENTLVFFCSDNGMNMGHHGTWAKGNATCPLNMWDSSVKVPAIISRPGHIPEGGVETGLFSQYDLLPTLLHYVDIAHPQAEHLPGRSFAPLLRGVAMPGREDVVVFDEYGPTRMVRSRDWKYVHRTPYGPHELFDLVNDPNEESNLVADPAQRDRIVAMRSRLETFFLRYVDPALDSTRQPVFGTGQIERVGHAAPGKTGAFNDFRCYRGDGNQPRPEDYRPISIDGSLRDVSTDQ